MVLNVITIIKMSQDDNIFGCIFLTLYCMTSLWMQSHNIANL